MASPLRPLWHFRERYRVDFTGRGGRGGFLPHDGDARKLHESRQGNHVRTTPSTLPTVGRSVRTESPYPHFSGHIEPVIVLDQVTGSVSWEASFAGDSLYQPSSKSTEYEIQKETISPDYTGDQIVPTTETTFALRATVFEEQDGYLGDLARASVSVPYLSDAGR